MKILWWLLISSFLTFDTPNSFGQIPEVDVVSLTKHIIELIDSNNVNELADHIEYPLKRPHPVPFISGPIEFKQYYNTLFDSSLKELIKQFNHDRDVFSNWKGIAIFNGTMWLSFEGKITTINYSSNEENVIRQKYIQEEKARLHPSVREFLVPILEWTTPNLTIRVDETNDGFQFSSWQVIKNTTDVPDRIIKNGSLDFEGSGGNHTYTFVNDSLVYYVSIAVIGSNEEGFLWNSLEIKQNGKTIFLEEPIITKGR